MVADEAMVFRWSGIASLPIGIALLLGAKAAKRQMS